MATSCNCPFKNLGLGGGEGEKAQPRPRLSLQHPPHDLVLHTADIQDHLCMNGFKMRREEQNGISRGKHRIKQKGKIQRGIKKKQRNNMGDEGDTKFEKE
jgi:hypothetical protein